MAYIQFHPKRRSLTNNIFNQVFQDLNQVVGHEGGGAHVARVNILETPETYTLEFAAPGFQKDDFEIKLNDGKLLVVGKAQEDSLPEGQKFRRKEFIRRSFERTFKLDHTIDQEGIGADYKAGILTVTLPKKEEVIHRNRSIEIA